MSDGTPGAPCPDDGVLAAFAVGDLPSAQLATVAAHVRECSACAGGLAGLDGAADEVVDALRDLRTAGPGDPVPDVLVDAAARAIAGGDGDVADAAGATLVVDHAGRLSRRLAAGPCRLGRFVLLEELGAGSFGAVFRARDTELDRIVALKVQRQGDLGSDRDRLLREARSAAQLHHPGIVPLHEAGQTEDGVCYLVSEFIAGETLERLLQRDRPGFEASARMVAEVALALQFAHERGIVHRDVKPSNILVDSQGRPHVTDFGLAKRSAADAAVTPSGEVVGTPAYMSPELARGSARDVDARSDVWSLGVVLYELLTGERPFRGNRRMVLLQVLEDEPRPPHELNEKVPRDLETICLRALAKAPQRRYESAAALAEDLLRFVRREPILARPPGPFGRWWRWCRRNPVAVVLLAAVTSGSALGFWHLTQLSQELVRRAAHDSARQYADLLELVNDLYSSEVVDRVGHHGVEATADYAGRQGGIPLPATMLNLLLERVGGTASGMRGSHYSDHPFRTRPDGGPRDGFQREALAALQLAPERPFFRFVDDPDGRPVLRFATARVMQQSCVACHNAHPDSTRRDWRPGDVRGVLEIVRPLERDAARIREGLRGTFALVGIVAAASLALIVLLAGRGRRRPER